MIIPGSALAEAVGQVGEGCAVGLVLVVVVLPVPPCALRPVPSGIRLSRATELILRCSGACVMVRMCMVVLLGRDRYPRGGAMDRRSVYRRRRR